MVCTDSLLNEVHLELLEEKSTYGEDWLLLSVKGNTTSVKVLTARNRPLVEGEKLYAVGWTRTTNAGPQRMYEFEYYKTLNNRLLLKDVAVPEKFGGLSGGL